MNPNINIIIVVLVYSKLTYFKGISLIPVQV